jgi:hypothetical protein
MSLMQVFTSIYWKKLSFDMLGLEPVKKIKGETVTWVFSLFERRDCFSRQFIDTNQYY